MNILLISHDMSLTGAPIALFNLADALQKLGHLVTTTYIADGPLIHEYENIGIGVNNWETCLNTLVKEINRSPTGNLVICNTITTCHFSKYFNDEVKKYLYIHESHLITDFLDGNYKLADELSFFSGVLAVSQLTSRILKTTLGISSTVLPCCVKIRSETNPPCQSDCVTICVIGTYDRNKGQDLAIESFKRLIRTNNVNAKLICAGRVSDASYKSELDADVAGFKNISLLGELRHSEILNLIEAADIVLISSHHEAMSLVAIEGLALRKVVICSINHGISDYLINGVSGYIIDSSTSGEICNVLSNAIKSRGKWASIGEAARQLYESEFSESTFLHRVDDFINSLAMNEK